jgi:hypothetical protein
MKASLIALTVGCAIASFSSNPSRIADVPQTNPPHVALLDVPQTNPPHIALLDVPQTNPPHIALADVPQTNPPHHI